MRPHWPIKTGIFLALIVALILLWDWDWFRPLVETQASAALGRKVTLGHFDVHLARHPQIVADGIALANPQGFPEGSKTATIDRLAIRIDPWKLFHHGVQLDEIEIERPQGDLHPNAAGEPNWKLGGDSSKKSSAPSPWSVDIGQLVINDGEIHFADPKLKADFKLGVRTENPKDGASGSEPHIVVSIDGTYSGQPITGRFIGGSVLSLRDPANPYSVDLKLANGATKVSLHGTLLEPAKLGGADLKLELSGSDLALLYPLTGIPLPPTPAYRLTGQLDYADRKIKFKQFAGTVGESDLSGNLAVDLTGAKMQVDGDLYSKKVVLADLAGFIGAPPGKADAPNQSAKHKEEHAQKAASPKLLPDKPINIPKLRSANLDIRYKAAHIESQSTPLDNIVANVKVEDGVLSAHPLSFAVGQGTIALNIELDGRKEPVHTVADIDFRKVDLQRLMQSTHLFQGAGTIGGDAKIDTTGNSMAKMLGNGNGGLRLFMSGGDLSAVLVDLAGLDFGNAVLSALSIPHDAKLRCMITDFGLSNGVLDTRTFVFDTTEANVVGSGTVNLRDEQIDYKLKTEPKHFNIGRIYAPILIRGPLKSPSVLPDPTNLAIRGGAAVILGVLATPLAALIPTIELGLGKDHNCEALLQSAQDSAKQTQATGTASPKKAAPASR